MTIFVKEDCPLNYVKSKTMKIRYLNPRYDAPFKYLLENNEFAKGLVSTIIGKEVLQLTPEPQEQVGIDAEPLKLVIYRKDFRAVIKTIENGKEKLETVKIEMQKSYISPHIDRFREYTGAEYSTPYKIEKQTRPGKDGKVIEYTKKHYLPIITIYFIEEVFNAQLPAVLKVGKDYYDVLGHKQYKGVKDKFVEILTHEAYFIQIKKLPKDLREDYEVLKIFRGDFVDKNELLMEIELDIDIYKGKSLLAIALFMLSSIAGDRKMQRKMREERKFEQTYLENLEQKELLEALGGELKGTKEKLEGTKEELEGTKEELEGTKEELEGTKEELEGTKEELEGTKEELEGTKIQLKQNRQALLESARIMKQAQIPIEAIQKATGLSKKEIEEL